MRNASFATLSLLTLMAAASAFGQQGMTIDIPFEFRVGTSVMPAGQYKVTEPSPGLTGIACNTRRVEVRVVTHTGGRNNEPDQGRLVFNQYGNTYFLSSIWQPGAYSGMVLPPSKAEKEEAARGRLKPTTQTLTARR